MCVEKEDQVYCVICAACDLQRGALGDVAPHAQLKKRQTHQYFDGEYAGHVEINYSCKDCGAWFGLIQGPGRQPFVDFWKQRWPPVPWRFDETILESLDDPTLRQAGKLHNKGLTESEIAESLSTPRTIVRRLLRKLYGHHLDTLGQPEALRRGLL